MSSIFARHQTHRLAAVVFAATACGCTGALADTQSDNLVAAAERGDLPAVNALLKSGADVNARGYTKYFSTTALIEASQRATWRSFKRCWPRKPMSAPSVPMRTGATPH
jgi:hypothetical protein